jgi:Uma2 family endonuclease
MVKLMESAARGTLPPPPLENGDCLDQKTFHERYEAMPEHVKAELIGGVTYMASPQKRQQLKAELIGGVVYTASPQTRRHGSRESLLHRWLDEYSEHTPGVECYANTTNILGPRSEPQPDGCLCIETDVDEDTYIERAPELNAEIASATESIDLHQKKADYEKAGVLEYVVAALRSRKVFWFVLRRGKYHEMQPDADGIYRSKVFPGLWLDPAALLSRDRKRLLAVLRRGMASPERRLS